LCHGCQESMKIGMKVDYESIATETLGLENAEQCAEKANAPVVNVDPDFTVPAGMTNQDLSFHRMGQMQELLDAAKERGQVGTMSIDQLLSGARPYRRPDYFDEWKRLKKAISLHRNGKVSLAQKKISEASKEYYPEEPITQIQDWLWRFVTQLCQPEYEPKFKALMLEISVISKENDLSDFWAYYQGNMRVERAKLYSDILTDYFKSHTEFSQVYNRVISGLDIPDDHIVTSVSFDDVKTFYGNAYETFGKSVELLAMLNNVKLGRKFDQFESLTLKKYQQLDNSSKFNCFALNAPFTGICAEKDGQIRNASHHRGISISSDNKYVSYNAGKGGTGQQNTLLYSSYLARSTNIFLQILTLLRVELIMCQLSEQKPPL
jgi:hypothetical protein